MFISRCDLEYRFASRQLPTVTIALKLKWISHIGSNLSPFWSIISSWSKVGIILVFRYWRWIFIFKAEKVSFRDNKAVILIRIFFSMCCVVLSRSLWTCANYSKQRLLCCVAARICVRVRVNERLSIFDEWWVRYIFAVATFCDNGCLYDRKLLNWCRLKKRGRG